MPTLPFRWVTQPVLGAACWSLTIVYFAAQPIVAAVWEPPYSFSTNSISDLGNTGCGPFERPDGSFSYVCSPRHALMNMVFIAVGLMTALGAFLTRRTWPQRPSAMVGLILIAVAGAGAIMVGLAPADENLVLHGVGALLQVPANVGLLLLGVASWRSHRRIAVFSLVCGSVGTAASVALGQRELPRSGQRWDGAADHRSLDHLDRRDRHGPALAIHKGKPHRGDFRLISLDGEGAASSIIWLRPK